MQEVKSWSDMYDECGIADETPFVVEWLIKHGIRVWSVNEGEQRLDNHTDKLMNYIRFWQADGESEKTSIRTKAGLGLLVESGHYKGGSCPFGYMLVKSGRLDKKGNEKKNLAVFDDEAVIVRKVFDLYVRHGCGVHKIAGILTDEGIKTRAGKNFQHATINNMIKNLTYTGILRSGQTRSELIPELQIIPLEMFEQAQRIMKQRNTDAANKRTYPMNTESRYLCYGKSRKQTDCHGQSGYVAQRLDDVVDGVIRYIFSQMKNIPKNEVVNHGLTALQQEQESLYKTAQRKYTKAAADLAELKAEVVKAIRGQSKFTPELLNGLITEGEKELAAHEAARNTAKQELDGCKHRMTEMQAQYDEVISWTELYDAADLPAKKMIVANLINRVEVSTDYKVHIDFNIDLSHFNIILQCA